MGNNPSVESTSGGRKPLVPSNHSIPEVRKANGWENVTDESTNHGWGSSSRSDGINDQGWMDKSLVAQDNGWGESAIESQDSTEKCSSSKTTAPEVSSRGWMDEPAKEDYKGWFSKPAKPEFNGWIDEPVKDEYNGWEVAENTQTADAIQPLDNPTLVPLAPSAPSAPPLPEEVVYESIGHFPSVNSSNLDLAVPSKMHEASTSSDAIEEKSSLCIICWEGPVEGACVPCGHMAGCMPCLHEIKSKRGDCPVCRAKIDQVVRLYAVV